MLTMLALLLQTVPAITVTDAADGGHVLTVEPFQEVRLAEISDLVAERAASTCGSRRVQWGTLNYTGYLTGTVTKPTRITGYTRDFRCIDASSFPPAPDNWKPKRSDEADARAATDAFYTAIDSGQWDRAFAMLDPGAGGPRANWETDQRRVEAYIGTGTRHVTGMRWLNNPGAAPHPGAYVRLTFAGEFSGTAVYCGSINFYRAGPGEYRQVGDQAHMLPWSEHPDAHRIAEYRAHYCE